KDCGEASMNLHGLRSEITHPFKVPARALHPLCITRQLVPALPGIVTELQDFPLDTAAIDRDLMRLEDLLDARLEAREMLPNEFTMNDPSIASSGAWPADEVAGQVTTALGGTTMLRKVFLEDHRL